MWSGYVNNYVTSCQTLLVNIFQSSGSGRKLVLCTSRSCKYAVSFIYTFTVMLKLVLILPVSEWWPSELCPSVWMSAKKVVALCMPYFNDFEEFYQQHSKTLMSYFFYQFLDSTLVPSSPGWIHCSRSYDLYPDWGVSVVFPQLYGKCQGITRKDGARPALFPVRQ